MKKLPMFLVIALMVFSGNASADLYDRGGGIIYDDALGITWLQDANYAETSGYDDIIYGYDSDGRMTWDEAVAWADQLEYGGYANWRLPQTLPVDGSTYDYSHAHDGSTDIGCNISAPDSTYPGSTASEMAYMYYNNLGNLSYYPVDYPSSPSPQPGWGLQSTGAFNNLRPLDYWSDTEYPPNTTQAWHFYFDTGGQNNHQKDDGQEDGKYYAWAVRDGDVAPVPIPSAVWLLGSGLVCLVGIRKKLKK